MKNVVKVLGIIAIVAVIGFGFVSCEDDSKGGDGGKLKIINNHATSTITTVTVSFAGDPCRADETFNANIAPGKTWEQFISFSGYGMALSVKLETNPPISVSYKSSVSLEKGETKTRQLTAEGNFDRVD